MLRTVKDDKSGGYIYGRKKNDNLENGRDGVSKMRKKTQH